MRLLALLALLLAGPALAQQPATDTLGAVRSRGQLACGVSTVMVAGAAMTPGFGSTTAGLLPVARSSTAGFQSHTAASSSSRVRLIGPHWVVRVEC